MNYTLRDPQGNVLLAVESSPVVTEADMKADLDKAAKACESAFDEVTKYQDAMAVMSTEGFGEQAKNIISKVLEKIKKVIGTVVNFVSYCFTTVWSWFSERITALINFFQNRHKVSSEIILQIEDVAKKRKSSESSPVLSMEYDGSNAPTNTIVSNNTNTSDVFNGCIDYLAYATESGRKAFLLYALNDNAVFENIVANLDKNVSNLEEFYPKLTDALLKFQTDLLDGNYWGTDSSDIDKKEIYRFKQSQDYISQLVEKFTIKRFNANAYIEEELVKHGIDNADDIVVKILDVYANDSVSSGVIAIAKKARVLEGRLRKSGIEKKIKALYASWDKLTKSFTPSKNSTFDTSMTSVIQNTCLKIQNSLQLLIFCLQDINSDINCISRYFSTVCRVEGVIETACKKIPK